MSVITVATPFNIELEFRIAPFHKRLLAWMIDLIIVYSYVYIVMRTVVRPLGISENTGDIAAILLITLPAYCYHLLCEVFMNGQSVGKKALGIKVMDMEGNEASLSQYLLRWSFRLVDMLLTLGAGAVLSAALSKHSQRIGDMLAGTVVIDQRARTDLTETIYLDVEDEAYQPMFRQVLNLSDRDINGIRNLLDVKGRSHDTDIYSAQVAARIKDFLKIETTLAPREFLNQLLKDYNYYTQD